MIKERISKLRAKMMENNGQMDVILFRLQVSLKAQALI